MITHDNRRNGHRPATKGTPPDSVQPNQQPGSQDSNSSESIMDILAKAKSLELELEDIQKEHKLKRRFPASSEQKSSAIRLQLCHLFSNLILLDPKVADSHSVTDRIWKYCFYGRIHEIRSRISQEKSQAKKRVAKGGESVESTASSENVLEMEKQMNQFLKEAVALYQYLIEKYIKMIFPFSQASTNTASQDSQEDYQNAILSSLYRMHIHLGDLHRYGSSYKQAEECYLKSARLSPGTGNPFNQLGVVAQSQDSLTAVALYYYARALMATNQPFETSRPNLIRLFETNHRWLLEHSRNDYPQSRGILSPDLGKKAQKEWLHKEKTALTRMALAKIVDLQWDFFRGVSMNDEEDKINLDKLKEKMTSLLAVFRDLICSASFSEPLLCKIIAILAFSTLSASNQGKICTSDQLLLKQKKDPEWNSDIIIVNQALAFSFLLRFCSILASHIMLTLSKKDGENQSLGAMRSLSPLLLGLHFITAIFQGTEWFHGMPFFSKQIALCSHLYDRNGFVSDFCQESVKELWNSVAGVANAFKPLQPTSSVEIDVFDYANVRDFSEMYCYLPFTPFLKKSYQQSNYASLDDLSDVFAPKRSLENSKGGDAETIVKIRLFLSVVREITRPSPKTDYIGVGPFFFEEEPSDKILRVIEDDNEGINDVPQQKKELDDYHEGATSISTSPTYADLGVPLLTPAALLGTSQSNVQVLPSSLLPQELNSRVTTDDLNPIIKSVSSQKTPQKTSIPPPPGFTARPPGDDPRFTFQSNSSWAVHADSYDPVIGTERMPQSLFDPSVPMMAPHTMNPFFQPSSSYHYNEISKTGPSSLISMVGQSTPSNAAIFSNKGYQCLEKHEASNGLGLLDPMESDNYSQHESLLNFLFELNDSTSEQEEHDSQRYQLDTHGIPHTDNPFVS